MLLSRAIAQAGRCAPDEETIIQPDLLWSTQWTAEFYRRLFNLFKIYPALWMLSRSNNWLERFNDFIFAPGFVLFNALLLLGPQTRDQLPALSVSWNCALPHDCTFPKLGLEYTYSSDMHACLQFRLVLPFPADFAAAWSNLVGFNVAFLRLGISRATSETCPRFLRGASMAKRLWRESRWSTALCLSCLMVTWRTWRPFSRSWVPSPSSPSYAWSFH